MSEIKPGSMQRRQVLKSLAALAVLGASGARAQSKFPAKPVRIIVPFAPGGSSDILARSIGQALTEAWHEEVIVENKPGAGGSIGAAAAARAEPDGYTLLMGHIGTLAVNPSLYPNLPYNPVTDFAPVALVAMVPNILVVHPDLPAHNVKELIALAKSKPGVLTYSSGGQGSAANLAVEYFKLLTGTDITHVPYKGTHPALIDLIAGHVSMTMTGLPPVLPQLRAGKLRALGVASRTRLAQVPDVPTIAESGVPGFEATQWYGLVAPAHTPPAIVEQIAAEVQRALARPDLHKHLVAEGAQPANLALADFGAFIREEIVRWGKVVRAAHIQVN